MYLVLLLPLFAAAQNGFLNTDAHTKFAAFSVVASSNDSLAPTTGQVSKHQSNPLLIQATLRPSILSPDCCSNETASCRMTAPSVPMTLCSQTCYLPVNESSSHSLMLLPAANESSSHSRMLLPAANESFSHSLMLLLAAQILLSAAAREHPMSSVQDRPWEPRLDNSYPK